MRVLIAAALVLAGCGRRHFDPVTDGAAVDDAPDATTCGHTFCDDFDRSTPLMTGWSGTSIGHDAIQEIAGGQYHVVVNDDTDQALIHKVFDPVTQSITVAFSLRYTNATPTVPADQEIDLVRLSWEALPVGTCSKYGFYLVRDGTSRQLDLQETYAGCGTNVDYRLRDLDNQPATTVALTVTFGPPTQIRVDLDGMTVHDMPAAHDAAPSPVFVYFGADVARNVTSDWDFYYDDVYVDEL